MDKSKEIRTNFDFAEFQEEAISKLKSGESLLGKGCFILLV
jgi:hypothetical protein